MREEQVLVMLHFLNNFTNIEAKGMKSKIGEMGNQLILEREDRNEMIHFAQKVTMTLHEETNSIDIVKKMRGEYDFQPIQDGGYSFHVVDNQQLYQFEIRDGQLQKHTATVVQNVRQDTFGNQNGIIVDFNTVSDALDNNNRRLVQANQEEASIIVDNASYPIPEGSKITDMVSLNFEGKSK